MPEEFFTKNEDDQKDDVRVMQLNDALEAVFGELHPYDIENIAGRYSESETTLIEIMKVGTRYVLAASSFDDAIYQSIEFPESVRWLLRPGDTLLVTMGFENRIWTVLYSSTCYEEPTLH